MHHRNLFLGALLTLATMPSLTFARPDVPDMCPHPDDVTFISLETASEISSEMSSGNAAPAVPPEAMPKVSVEKSGTIPAKEGMRLRVNADPGNVHIFTDESTQISYRIRIEADAREPGADEFVREFTITARQTPRGILLNGNLPWRGFHGPFGVSYEIHIPRRFNITVRTEGGNIEVQDIEGRVDLSTDGGNITVGRVDAGSRAPVPPHADGGQVAARLVTMGGHIAIEDVAGTLRASTSGGHITTGNVAGDAILRTGGGQIRTGQISGVGTLETGGGNIATSLGNLSGTEPAFSAADSKNDVGKNTKNVRALQAASQFVSSEGDVVVYMPRDLAATIDAMIEKGGGHRIIADRSLPQKISCEDSGVSFATVRCVGDINGGGEVLHLRAASGNIILRLNDPKGELSAASSANLMDSAAHSHALQPQESPSVSPSDASINSDDPGDYNDAAGFFAEVRRRILESWWGGVPVDAEEMQKHLAHSVAPVYPDVARKAGVEGDVILRICVSSEGRVTDLKVLDGPPILARATVEAVQQWQYHAMRMNGQPVAAVTTMIVSFRLQ